MERTRVHRSTGCERRFLMSTFSSRNREYNMIRNDIIPDASDLKRVYFNNIKDMPLTFFEKIQLRSIIKNLKKKLSKGETGISAEILSDKLRKILEAKGYLVQVVGGGANRCYRISVDNSIE